jgi:uncharacterized protein YegL
MESEPLVYTPWIIRPSGRHLVAAAAATLLSVAAHVALLRLAPPLPVGRPPTVNAYHALTPVHLRDVRRNMSDALARPEVYRPENPEQHVDLTVPARELQQALQEVAPAAPELDTGPLAGEEKALLEPAPADARARWEPRQEILQIEEKLLADEVAALPRKYESAGLRSAEAPDVTLPVEWGEPGAAPGPAGIDLLARRAGPDAAGGFPGFVAGSGGVGGDPIQAESSLLDESLDEITDLQPVEQLLAVNLHTLRSAAEPEVTYFKIEIQRRGSDALPVLPKDVLLIQDCSESMTQRKLNACKRGLRAWIQRLGPDDRFEILAFREKVTHCFGGWSAPGPRAESQANFFIEDMVARGRTDVFESLQQMLRMSESGGGRPLLAVLITDGRPTMGLVDSSEIIEQFTRQNEGRVSVFAFGGGQRVNRYLLDLLSYKNRGDSMVVVDREHIPAGLETWAVQLARPVLADLKYRFSGLDESEVYPRALTHLYLDRPLSIMGRVEGPLPPAAFQVVGHSGAARHDMVFPLRWEQAQEGGEGLRAQWAWQKVYHLIGEHIRTGDAAAMAEIQSLETRYGFVVPYGGDIVRRF